MKTEQIQNWLQIAGLAAVTMSLVFVGAEIRQSRQIAIADVYQQRTALVVSALTARYSPELWYAAIRKRNAGEELDEMDIGIIGNGYAHWMAYHENSHFQNQQGLLSDQHWAAGRNHIRTLSRRTLFRDWWERGRDVHRDTFADEVDQIIQEVRSEMDQ